MVPASHVVAAETVDMVVASAESRAARLMIVDSAAAHLLQMVDLAALPFQEEREASAIPAGLQVRRARLALAEREPMALLTWPEEEAEVVITEVAEAAPRSRETV